MVNATAATNQGPAQEETLSSLVSYWLWKICPPVILVFGSFGNMMTIVVMRRISARQSAFPMSTYFIALAVSDTLLLCVGLNRHWILYSFGFDVRTLHGVMCKIHLFTLFTAAPTSAWLLVVMTVQRLTSVMWPHRANTLCIQRKACVCVAAIIVFLALSNAHFLYSFEVASTTDARKACVVPIDKVTFYFETKVQPWIGMICASFLPFCLLLACNVLLVWKVLQSMKTVGKMGMNNSTHVSSRQRKTWSLTRTLIMTSSAFLLMTLPFFLYLILTDGFLLRTSADDEQYWLLGSVSILLMYTNYAINFYLYCLSGSKFSTEFKSLFCVGKVTRVTSMPKRDSYGPSSLGTLEL